MRNIVVTGGAGRLGQLAVAELLAHGYQVLAVDRIRPSALQCRFLQADLANAGEVLDVLAGSDAVLHLGAIPGPTSHPQRATFENNVLSTYHVVETAAALGLAKVVFASSVFAVGWVEEAERYWPRQVPVDEQHPLEPFEAYGLSKQVGEDICGAASRRTGMPTVSLRIMNVIHSDGYFALPWPAPTREMGVRFVLWPYVDARDVARSCRLALEAETRGHEAIFIAAADTRFDVPTRELLSELAPADLDIHPSLDGRDTVVSLQKARQLIGYVPEFDWAACRPES